MLHDLTPLIAGIVPGGLLDSTLNIFLVILGVGFLIFVHELGHFAVAKWSNVYVEAFSLGFGPYIGWKRGETEYRLSLIPLGGYVKMAGEGLPVEGEEMSERELRSKSTLTRAAVFSAGVIMNAFTGMVLFVLVFAFGVSLKAPIVGAVDPGSPAWEAGLRSGDRVIDIDGHRPIDFEDLAQELTYAGQDGVLNVRVERGDGTADLTIHPKEDPRLPIAYVGVGTRLAHLPRTNRVRVVGDPARSAGLQSGDRILAVDDQSYANPNDITDALVAAGDTVRLTVDRGGEMVKIEIPISTKETGKKLLGIQTYDGEVQAVQPGSAAERAGFRSGDRFLRVGGVATPTFRAVVSELFRLAPPQPDVVVTVGRDDAEVELRCPIRTTSDRARLLEGLSTSDTSSCRFAYVDANIMKTNRVRDADIPQGATITSIDGKSVSTWAEIQEAIVDAEDADVRIGWSLDGQSGESGPLAKQPQLARDVGFSQVVAKETVREGFGTAVVVGFQRSVLMGKRVLQTIGGIVSGSISGRALGGPILIFSAAKVYAEQSIGELLLFLGLLSVNLAIINLLPIPILDGGHLLFLLVEKVKGSPVKETTFALAQWVGLVLILALLVYVTFNDILRLL